MLIAMILNYPHLLSDYNQVLRRQIEVIDFTRLQP